MKTIFEQSREVTDKIMKDVISNFKVEGSLNQIKVQIHPIISNAMYHREKEILEKERFETIIALARTLDNKNMESAIKALGYELTAKKRTEQ